MANAYLDAAYAITLPAGQKSVLVALANRANNNGECFPSVRCISADTGLGRSTIHAHLKTLVTDKIIEKTNQFRKDNSQTSNLYKLLIEPVKKAAKKVKKAAKKLLPNPVDMGNKEFDGEIDAPALSAQITDSQKLDLDYDNDQWGQVIANIGARALELYPNAGIQTVKEAIEEHVEHWLLKANDNPRLTLTLGQLRAQFIQREREFLEFLNSRNQKVEVVSECLEPCHRPYNPEKHNEDKAAADVLNKLSVTVEAKEECERELGHTISFEEFQQCQEEYTRTIVGECF